MALRGGYADDEDPVTIAVRSAAETWHAKGWESCLTGIGPL